MRRHQHISNVTSIARKVGALSIGAMIAGASLLAAPQQASAMTLADIDAKLEELSAQLNEKEQALADAQAALSSHLTDDYKGEGSMDLVQIVMMSDGLSSFIENMQYNDAITNSYQNAVKSAEEARDEVEATKQEYEELQQRKIDQRKSLSEMGETWYFQGDYSDVYWGGTIATHGCGLCARTFIISSLTGQDLTVQDVLYDNGDWLGMDKSCTDHSGTGSLSHAEWMKQRYDILMSDVSDKCRTTDGLREVLDVEEGMVMIVSRGSNLYHNKSRTSTRGTNGHYVVIYAAADDGGFYVHDSSFPNGEGGGVYYTEDEMQNLLNHTSVSVLFQN